MRAFAAAWPDQAIVQQVAAQLPWGHHMVLLDRLKDPAQREWYLRAAVEYGWSRNILVLQIKSGLQVQRTLPPPDSDLAEQILKDPYNFDFLTVTKEAHEREIERGLLIHLRDLLLELGRGFAFLGSQVPLEVAGESFYLDLLFYHVRLKCYFVIELKSGPFKPEWAGKLNFYLSAVDDLMRTDGDAPTIGLLLCESHRSPIVQYTLRNIEKPIGVSSYRVTRELPAPIREEVPTVEDLQEVVTKLRDEIETLRQERHHEE
jgi:predicted nuclease of restriction endonuclease-like (RecB) superfamily